MSCLYLSVQVLFCFFGQSLNYDHVSLFTLLKESHSRPSITLFLPQWSGKSSWVKPSQEKIYIYLLWFGTLAILINSFQHINNRNTMSQRRREEEGSALFRYLPHISAWCWSYIVIDIKWKRLIFRWYEFNETQSSLKPWFLSPHTCWYLHFSTGKSILQPSKLWNLPTGTVQNVWFKTSSSSFLERKSTFLINPSKKVPLLS